VRRRRRRVVRGSLRTVGTGVCELARPGRVDSREVDVGVDGAQYGAQSHQHQQYDHAHEHRPVTFTPHIQHGRYVMSYVLSLIC